MRTEISLITGYLWGDDVPKRTVSPGYPEPYTEKFSHFALGLVIFSWYAFWDEHAHVPKA